MDAELAKALVSGYVVTISVEAIKALWRAVRKH